MLIVSCTSRECYPGVASIRVLVVGLETKPTRLDPKSLDGRSRSPAVLARLWRSRATDKALKHNKTTAKGAVGKTSLLQLAFHFR